MEGQRQNWEESSADPALGFLSREYCRLCWLSETQSKAMPVYLRPRVDRHSTTLGGTHRLPISAFPQSCGKNCPYSVVLNSPCCKLLPEGSLSSSQLILVCALTSLKGSQQLEDELPFSNCYLSSSLCDLDLFEDTTLNH
jgi:hypothetical protein